MSELDQAIKLRDDLIIPTPTKDDVISYASNAIDYVLRHWGEQMPKDARERLSMIHKNIVQEFGGFPVQQFACPMCGATAFTIDPNDGSQGYCAAENKAWVIRPCA